MVSYRKRGSSWQYEISYKDIDGKYKKIRQSGFNLKSEAITAANKIQIDHPLLHTVRSSGETLDAYFSHWITVYKKGVVSKITYDKYLNTSNHIHEIFGKLRLKDISRRIYQERMNLFALKHARRTVSCFHKQIRASILDALDEQIIVLDFTRKVVIKGNDNYKKAKVSLNYEQWKLLINNLNPHCTSDVIIYIAAVTGMRYGEILGLTPKDVDFDNNEINVNKTWDYKYGTGFKKTKTKTSMRVIPIDDHSTEFLKKYLYNIEYRQDCSLFITKSGRTYVSAEINKFLTNKLESLSLPRITFHGLRHTHASILLYQGVTVLSVSRRLGHSNITTTQSTYLHIIKELEEKDEDIIKKVIDKALN